MSDEHPWLKSKPAVIRKGLDALDDFDAFGLYWAIWNYMGSTGADGILPKRLMSVSTSRRLSQKKCEALLTQLLEQKLYEDAGDCIKDPNWAQPPIETWTDDVLRDRWKRDKDLKRNGELCRGIKARDRHLCRYCGERVNWADKKGRLAGTYDHVDPDGDNSPANVVVACKRCNSIKKDRTPEQAGMPLYLPGTTAASIAAGTAREVAASAAQDSAPEPRARSHDPDPIQIGSRSRPGSARAPARDRTEPDRVRSDPDRTSPPHAGESHASLHQPQSQEGSLS